MKEIIGILENGQIKLPSALRLPDGLAVRVVWDEQNESETKLNDRESVTGEDIKTELQWATGKRFSS